MVNAVNKNYKKIVCIGGGTGTFVVLSGLKFNPEYKLTAIVTMSDSGGSNKKIIDDFGLLPTSDIRQCFVALADEDTGRKGLFRKLFMYRFEKGEGISGMTFGNLFMAALSDIVGSQAEAIKQTSKVLRIRGKVLPVSFTKTNLFAEYENGHVVTEEHLIDEPVHDGKLKITKLYLKPEPVVNPDAIKAILDADFIILGPGDLYTSLLPNLIIEDVAKALKQTKAKKIYVLNLMTKYGQTYNFSAVDHIAILEKYFGEIIDYVVVNNGNLPEKAIPHYEEHFEFPVINDLPKQAYYATITDDIVSDEQQEKSKSDILVRSLIRHDSNKLAKVLQKIIG